MPPKSDKPKVIDIYFSDVEKYQKQFGPKTAVYIQVGDFYEIYGAELPDGTRMGILDQIADACNLTVSQKKVCLGVTNDAKVYMAGFPVYMLDKFVNILVDEVGWTVVVIKQDEQCAGTTRSVEGIYSPGTNIRTSQDSNTIVMIVLEKVKSRINKGTSTLYIGMSSLDCITGHTTVYETFSYDQNNMLSYDEIQKFISAKNPREVLIETMNLEIEENDLTNALNLGTRPTRFNFIKYGKVEKSITTQCKFFEQIYSHKSKVSVIDFLGLQYKEYGRLSLMLLLRYIMDHSNIMLNQIGKTEVWEMNTQLILANNSLEQLNIIENRFNNREPSLIKILDMTSTVLGRRGFRNRLLNPIRDTEILNQRYSEIKEFMDYQKDGTPSKLLCLEIESTLKNIRDLERLHRRIAMGNLMPIELSGLIISYKSIIDLFTIIKKVKSEQIKEKFLPDNEDWNKFISLFEKLNTMFDLEKTSFNTLEKIDRNFFKIGCNKTLDEQQFVIDHSLNVFKELAKWIDEIVSEKDINKNIKNIARYDYGEQFEHHIYMTKNRFNVLSEKINEKIKNGETSLDLVVSKSEFNQDGMIVETTRTYMIDFKSFTCVSKSRSVNNNDVVIILKDPNEKDTKKAKNIIQEPYSILDKHNKKIKLEMDALRSTVVAVYKETIADIADNYLDILKNMTRFVTDIDVVKAGAKMAIEKSFTLPQIVEHDNSFIDFKGIRHPIIEHINQKIHYVDNDVALGNNETDGILLFGVNASGKSSLMKAIGINLILAQAGFFVACKELKYSPFEYLFTRIWNNDNIFKGQSTFEVEISELKSIIKYASNKSLVLGDELCSGTETVSASAIVTAGIKKLSRNKAKFIFATHLHFLADNQHLIHLDNVKNYHLSVIFDKVKDKLIYDRKLKEGSGPSTYGLEVCKAMGLEDDFLEEAFKIRNEITNEIMGSFLNNKPSKYNQNVRIIQCQVCNAPGDDVHHIQFQCTADNNGKIGSIDKNRESNLVVLCKKCHVNVHHPKSTLKINGYIETSTGIELDYIKN
jgi:DNA mismatch repair protein MutS